MRNDIVIIGSGNLARHFAKRLALSNFNIQILARSDKDAADFKNISDRISYITQPNQINPNATYYAICVKDDAIIEVAASLPFKLSKQQFLLHTSGASSSELLKPFATHFGVVWPIMSITKIHQIQDSDNIPFVITASDQTTEFYLSRLTQILSSEFSFADDKTRQQMHLVAVISNNFTNHLFALAYKFCNEHRIDFDKFKPIIMETINRMQGQNPGLLQTGPAIRGDNETINQHLNLLETDADLSEMYRFFTESIFKLYQS